MPALHTYIMFGHYSTLREHTTLLSKSDFISLACLIFAIFRVLKSFELQIGIARNSLEISILGPKQFYSRLE